MATEAPISTCLEVDLIAPEKWLVPYDALGPLLRGHSVQLLEANAIRIVFSKKVNFVDVDLFIKSLRGQEIGGSLIRDAIRAWRLRHLALLFAEASDAGFDAYVDEYDHSVEFRLRKV